MTADQLTSVLHDRHEAAGAKFAEFGGWLMPLEYTGVLAEHTAVRERVGLFDVSHLGKALVIGPGAAGYLNTRLTNDLSRIGTGQAQYTLLCAEDGGTVDDLIAYRRSDDEVFLIPNASNTAEVVKILQHDAPEDVTVTNHHRDYAVLAVQGPRSDELLASIGLPVGHDYMRFATATLGGAELTVCRTGYTGERGYELVCASADAGAVWDAVVAAGVPYGLALCGLGARDTLRTEMGYPLHGNDLSRQISPVEAGILWAVGWKKPVFDGAQALRAQRLSPHRVLRGLKATGRGIPRHGMEVVDADDTIVGEVTSGTFSPTLRQGIALALVDPSVVEGDQVGVVIRLRTEAFDVVKPPFVTPGVRGA
jgi:aminomethyltransferase